MKVVFLDVDGVLNCWSTEETTPTGNRGIESKYVSNLSKIINDTGAEIILSSDWKKSWLPDYSRETDYHYEDGKYLDSKLAEFGLKIRDKTKGMSRGNDGHSQRGHEIRNYLANHPDIERFVILDDVWFLDFDESITPFFVRTNEVLGLTEKATQKAISILNDEREI